MSGRIEWDKPGARVFETGVSQGVLYPPGAPAVPWNGLISVNEEVDGGESSSYHRDGVKYLDAVSGEDYQATIQAYTYPDEFALLDGSVSVAPGLYAMLQPRRKTFGLSYRTGIGNDLQGLDYGYKIHLVYNAMVIPSPRSYESLADQTNAQNFQWTIKAVPPSAGTYRPTAHFVLDSREVPLDTMTFIEDILYGRSDNILEVIDGGTPSSSTAEVTDGSSASDVLDGGHVTATSEASLPSPAELITLLKSVA